ncbi:hypothetical protein [Nannocystis bainbridge]|uniref:Uncharacterized protein n=1 Tax=Nannocystis bainbridge TaxID=2995303 RepID=A0ABT5DRE9_9BACT|nr:hypothetical protein [Nannocystis bainbridge]MDC0716234.1 hypothetical protein [Nannocystis bainbridge]
MFSLINPTRLHTQPQLLLDAHGEERLLLVVKGSFEFAGEVLRPTEAMIVLADQYHGDPSYTSLLDLAERLAGV